MGSLSTSAAGSRGFPVTLGSNNNLPTFINDDKHTRTKGERNVYSSIDHGFSQYSDLNSQMAAMINSVLGPKDHDHLSNQGSEELQMSNTAEDDGVSTLGVILLASFTLLINFIFVFLAYIYRRRRLTLLAEHANERASRSAAQNSSGIFGDGEASEESLKQRYSNIESWLVNKTVCRHDELCEKIMAIQSSMAENPKKRLNRQRTSSVETLATEDDEEWASSSASSREGLECPICLDEIDVDDVASWSVDPDCSHVFHHACIKEWLLKNSGCPFCRHPFLPVDRLHDIPCKRKQITELLMARQDGSKPCYYCVSHGIVVLPHMHVLASKLSQSEMHCVEARARISPDRNELVEMRRSTGPAEDDASKAVEDVPRELQQDSPIDGENLVGDESLQNGFLHQETADTVDPDAVESQHDAEIDEENPGVAETLHSSDDNAVLDVTTGAATIQSCVEDYVNIIDDSVRTTIETPDNAGDIESAPIVINEEA